MRLLIAAIALTGMALASPQALAADPLVIKFSHVVAENTPKGQMANRFKELVDERLAGKVTVEVYPNSQLFNDDTVVPAMLLGDVHLAAPALSKFGKYTSKLQVFDLPFLFKDLEAAERFQKGPAGEKLLTSMTDKGILGLGFLHNGLKQLSASKPLMEPADANGLKFRIMQSDVLASQFEALEATPLKKPFSEVFTLLQTKAIDGQENTWSNIYSKKFFEVQEYITESNHGLLDYLVVTSDSFWKGLPDDIRSEVGKALNDAIAHGNKIALEKAVNDRQRILDSGRTKLIELTDEQRLKWVEAMKPVWKQFEDEIGKDIIDAAVAANASS